MAKINRDALKGAIRDHCEVICRHFFPAGKRYLDQWIIGNCNGDPGKSLKIELCGEKAGLAHDFATGQGWDLLNLLKECTGLRFVELARQIGSLTGINVEDSPAASYYTTGKNKGPRYRTSAGDKTCDWDKDYQMSEADIDELAQWRGYSREFVQWLIEQQLIGRSRKQKYWAFPFKDSNGKIVSAHVRKDKDHWFYDPPLKNLGFSVQPLIVGDLSKAEKAFSDESPWDILAVCDKLGIHYGELIAGIATRGAANAALVATIKVDAELYVIPQNDTAGRAWAESLGTVLSKSFKLIAVPENFHDVNDWLQALSDIGEFIEAIRTAATKEPGGQPAKTERVEAFGKSMVNGQKFASIQVPPKEVIIEDWLKAGETGFIYASRGTGKTWLTLSLCIAIAEAIPFGPWSVPVAYRVLYIDGEMSHEDNVHRIEGLSGKIPENLTILNHEVLFYQSGQVINLACREDQEIILEQCLALNIKVLVLDNLSCLFTGVSENDADEWEKINPWLLELRRHRVSPIIVHHAGLNPGRMRGTTKREDAASWVLRLDNRKDDSSQLGADFISRFTKYRGELVILDYEWRFEPDGNRIRVTVEPAASDGILLQWVKDGLTHCEDIAREMGISKGQASKIATRLIAQGLLRKKGREYQIF
jgi:hypothetical protein